MVKKLPTACLHLLIQEEVLQEVIQVGVYMCRNPGHVDPKGPDSGSSPEPGGFHGIQGFTPLILGWLLHILQKGVATAVVFHF